MTFKGRPGIKKSKRTPENPLQRGANNVPPTGVLSLPILSFLQNSNAGMLVTDEKHRFIWANEIYLDYFSALPTFLDDFFHQPYNGVIEYMKPYVLFPDAFEMKMKELRRKKKPYFGWELLFSDGAIREVSYIPIFEKKSFQGSVWQIVDVTKQKREQMAVRDYANKYSVVLNHLNAAVCETDVDGNITHVHHSFCRLSGYSEEELIGQNITELFVPQESREYARNLRKYRVDNNVPLLYDLEIILKDGTRKWVLASSSNIYDAAGKPVGGVGIHMDITAQKLQQIELEKARHAAEEAQRIQKEFLANMSHEIRTPLNAIIGMIHLLNETALDEDQKEYIKILKHSSGILHDLITDILDISKIEAGKLDVNPREFDLRELVQSMTETFQLKLGQRPIKLTVEFDKQLDSLLVGDDKLLNQILMNLLGNAEKFTKEGEIALSVDLDRRIGNTVWAKFRVCDTGIGIKKDKLELIFQNYKQAEKDIRERYGGTGLGLAIAKQLVELQGGQIYIEEAPVFNTCFTFTLPLADTGKPLMPTSELEQKYARINFGSSKVLVVEDNQMNLKYILSLLEKYKIDYQLATNGPDALYFLNSKQFDLVLMDIRIPGMDGFELAKKIREDESKPNVATPVIATTAAAVPSTITKARVIGITDILTKPYTPDQLLLILNKYLNEDETELIMEVPNYSGYEFHPKLDVRYLNSLYESNIGYAVDLFEIFVMTMEEEMQKLLNTAKNKDLEQLKFQVHKIKPNFSMVGLTWITGKMETLEDYLRKNNDVDVVTEMLTSVQQEVIEFFPIIKEELGKMQDFIKK
ncbi:hypothetical protein COR50_11995 [Chitinophaga caeni]|uniref:Sensory/regulatory protein RpfC n=1 Tax=Chitinophaga caeni TaxID=2029983 RepID=A0A291QV66_9BACT|nr:PAS domain-containing hybrid sensor histidine kinase/response regulator [Chitinophaga caeni]ATL47827.1 hypothetical protein COR50_11995 [Chitinophaga caeni]